MGRPISEADQEDYRQQNREEKMRARLEEMGRRGGPDAAEACEDCEGEGYGKSADDGFCGPECPRCQGTGVQP